MSDERKEGNLGFWWSSLWTFYQMRVRCVKHYLRLDRLSTFEKQTSGGIPCACCLLGTSCRFWMCKNSKIRRMQEDCSLLESRLHWYLDMSPAGRRRSANIVLLCFFNFKCHQQLPTTLEASTLPLRWTKFYLPRREEAQVEYFHLRIF